MGAAFSVDLAKRLNMDAEMPNDSIVVCNFGDASSNHSTTQGAINSTAWAAYQSIPMPIVYICEDNGIGISTSTPKGWISANYQNRAGINYLYCDGLNILDTYQKAKQAEYIARKLRKSSYMAQRMLGNIMSILEETLSGLSGRSTLDQRRRCTRQSYDGFCADGIRRRARAAL